MRFPSTAVGLLLVATTAGGAGGCATAVPTVRPASPAICGFAVDSERAALRVRGVFAGLRGDVARHTAAPGTEDGFVFEHAAQSVRVQVAGDGAGQQVAGVAGAQAPGWTATLTPRTDVRVVRVGTWVCVFTRTVVDGPDGLASVRDDVHEGVATPMLARLEHEMRSGW